MIHVVEILDIILKEIEDGRLHNQFSHKPTDQYLVKEETVKKLKALRRVIDESAMFNKSAVE